MAEDRTQWPRWFPSQDFRHQGTDVRQIRPVAERRYPIWANDTINFCLSFVHNMGMVKHQDEEVLQNGFGGISSSDAVKRRHKNHRVIPQKTDPQCMSYKPGALLPRNSILIHVLDEGCSETMLRFSAGL